MRSHQRGFSLVELMIVVVIIGIIASFGIPMYKKNVVNAQRTAAQAALLEMANAMERQKLRTGTYLGAADNSGVPKIFAKQVPYEGTPKTYNLKIKAQTVSYLLKAEPIAGSTQATNGALSLDSLGVRRWEKDGTGTGFLYDWDGVKY